MVASAAHDVDFDCVVPLSVHPRTTIQGDKVKSKPVLIFIALLISTLCIIQVALARPRPPGLPNYTHPTDPREREAALERAWEVYAAIDAATQDKELRAELRRICRRESACNWIGLVTYHEGDAAGGRDRWRAAVARGLLRPDECEAHQLGEAARWTTYGAFGVASAWTVRYLGECVGPSALDDPRAAAHATVAWMKSLCRRHKACDCEGRVKWWVGPGIWEERSRLGQLDSVQRQCGNVVWWRWIEAAVDDLWMLLDQ